MFCEKFFKIGALKLCGNVFLDSLLYRLSVYTGTYFHPNQHSGQLFPTGRKLKLLTDAANNITSIRHYALLIQLFKCYTTLLLLLSSALNSLTFPLTHCSCCRIYLHSVAGWGLLKMVGVAMAMVAMPDFTSMDG